MRENSCTSSLLSETFEEIGEIAKEYGIEGFGDTVKNALAATSGFSGPNNLSSAYPNIPFFQSENGWEIAMNIFPFVEQLTYNRDFYFNFSGAFREVELQVDANSGNWPPEEVIPNIDCLLAKFGGELSFDTLISLGTNQNEQKWLNKFYSAWLMLDWLGYKRDKLKKKTSTMKNIVNDLNHAYYGAHCALLITDHTNLRAKAKALYTHWGISTKVLSPQEFIPHGEQLMKAGNAPSNELFETLLIIIEEPDYARTFLNRQYRARKLEGYLLNHFNLVLESPTPLQKRQIALIKDDSTLEEGYTG